MIIGLVIGLSVLFIIFAYLIYLYGKYLLAHTKCIMKNRKKIRKKYYGKSFDKNNLWNDDIIDSYSTEKSSKYLKRHLLLDRAEDIVKQYPYLEVLFNDFFDKYIIIFRNKNTQHQYIFYYKYGKYNIEKENDDGRVYDFSDFGQIKLFFDIVNLTENLRITRKITAKRGVA